MAKVKNIILLLITFIAFFFIFLNFDKIKEQFYNTVNSFNNNDEQIVYPDINMYARSFAYNYVKDVTSFDPKSYDDLVNIFYTILNNGWTEATFYCNDEYDSCLSDLDSISHNDILLSNINNFVSPYNSYSSIKTTYDDTGKVTIYITHLYSDSEILQIDKLIDEMIDENTTDNMTNREKIKALHDYIINNTKYDTKRAETDDSTYDSARIQGVLFDHYAICSGYADIMAVILDKLGIANYKISSDNHVWNGVRLDGVWYHLDLTWDDPVSTSGKEILSHDYFLISSTDLYKLDTSIKEHVFDTTVYSEFE